MPHRDAHERRLPGVRGRWQIGIMGRAFWDTDVRSVGPELSQDHAGSGHSVRAMVESVESFPLPGDPLLAVWASALDEAGAWATLWDADRRVVFLTGELRSTYRAMGASIDPPMGVHFASAEIVGFYATTFGGPWASREFRRAWFLEMAASVLADMAGGREELRRVVDPEFADLVDEVLPVSTPPIWMEKIGWESAGRDVTGATVRILINHDDGRRAGTCVLSLGATGMSDLGRLVAAADPRHLARMRVIERADRHPGAILMADLESSTPLARRMSSAAYFAFGRRLVRAADRCVIDAGGIVGRHAGDGVVAFFLAETMGSESAAARACISAARDLRDALPAVAARSDLSDAEVSLRFGLHWGAMPYMGWILTGGRSEVTALGDEVNEAARIEACATGSRTLASKHLIERLDRADADALGLDLAHMTYTQLVDLPTATEKARRDAPSISVSEV